MLNSAKKIFQSALNAVNPEVLVKKNLHTENGKLILPDSTTAPIPETGITVLGMGKAAAGMVKAIQEIVTCNLKGLIAVKAGCELMVPGIETIISGHPEPDSNSLIAGRKMRKIAESAGKSDLVIVAVSGGGSANVVLPIEGNQLSDKIFVTQQLLKSGASIEEINLIRRGLSQIKGGGLARMLKNSNWFGLIISDVPEGKAEVVASGPTSLLPFNPTEFQRILNKYDISLPLKTHLKTEIQNERVSERNFLLASNDTAVSAAEVTTRTYGYQTQTLKIYGCAESAAKKFAEFTRRKITYPIGIIGGGETTVKVTGSGKGGRNQQLVLHFLKSLQQNPPLCRFAFLSASTDGTDGPTDAAGGFLDNRKSEELKNTDPARWIENNDAYNFLLQNQMLYKTGSTGTNTCDLQILLLQPRN